MSGVANKLSSLQGTNGTQGYQGARGPSGAIVSVEFIVLFLASVISKITSRTFNSSRQVNVADFL